MKQILHLGKTKNVIYPLSSEDYQLLVTLKFPVVKFGRDHLPLLIEMCRKQKVKIDYTDFETLETVALDKIRRVWPDYFEGQPGDKVLTWLVPNKKKFIRRALDLAQKLQAWYAKNYVKTEIETRRSKNKFKTLIRKIK